MVSTGALGHEALVSPNVELWPEVGDGVMGVALVLFWPALFFIDSDDKKEEVGRFKGELRALDQASIQKNCTVLAQAITKDKAAAAKVAEEKRRAEQKGSEDLDTTNNP